MLIEEMYLLMDDARKELNEINEQLGCTKTLFWGSWENHQPKYFFDTMKETMEDDEYGTSIGWCFDKLGIDALFETFYYAQENEIPIVIFPERLIIIVCKDKEAMLNVYSKLDKGMLELLHTNIDDIEEDDTGMMFRYHTKISYREFQERPEFVYELINDQRSKPYDK